MATLVPPPSKKQKRLDQQPRELEEIPQDLPNVTVRFQASDTGAITGGNVRVPGNATEKQLELLLNQLAKDPNDDDDDDQVPYSFALYKPDSNETVDIHSDLYTSILKPGHRSTEDVFTIVYTPRAVFKVRPVTRSSDPMTGHGATILAAQFAPHTSSRMVTGSGDATARIWDCDTYTPFRTLSGHTDWVLAVGWSPDGTMIATGSQDKTVRLWNPKTGEQIGAPYRGHTDRITGLCWEPLHLVANDKSPRLASCSKDGTIRVWDVDTHTCSFTMSGHKSTVSCVKWGGMGDIYSTSHDRTVKVWSSKDGRLIHNLQAHAHWVNHLALSTEYSLRTGPFDHRGKSGELSANPSAQELREKAKEKFEKQAKIGGRVCERIVTASDDFTMYLWEPAKGNKPLCRMTGHQKVVNHVAFSPDGRFIASASFDKSVKLWNGIDGKFISTFRGHVASVYQCAWSSDCRLLVSCSKDTTVKVWDVGKKKLLSDLPGHRDEVYAVDWSVDGNRVASGGKDKSVRIWTH